MHVLMRLSPSHKRIDHRGRTSYKNHAFDRSGFGWTPSFLESGGTSRKPMFGVWERTTLQLDGCADQAIDRPPRDPPIFWLQVLSIRAFCSMKSVLAPELF